MGFEQPARFGMNDERDAKRRRDALGRDVVMRRADAAGRQDVIEFAPDLVDGRDDRRGIVGDDSRLAQPHAGLVETLGEKPQIRVLDAAGEDLVADDQNAGGDGFLRLVGLAHLLLALADGIGWGARPPTDPYTEFIGKAAMPAQPARRGLPRSRLRPTFDRNTAADRSAGFRGSTIAGPDAAAEAAAELRERQT